MTSLKVLTNWKIKHGLSEIKKNSKIQIWPSQMKCGNIMSTTTNTVPYCDTSH